MRANGCWPGDAAQQYCYAARGDSYLFSILSSSSADAMGLAYSGSDAGAARWTSCPIAAPQLWRDSL